MSMRIRLLHHLLILCFLSFIVILQHKSDAHEKILIRLENPRLKKCRIDKIYQLGDSFSDAGNRIREKFIECARLPYGMNFFQNKPTGRCSDGMLMIDFIALESGLPLLNPYKYENANFRHGVNFAVAGATALSPEILAKKNIIHSDTKSILNVQLDWMSSHFETTCSPDCRQHLKNSLFLVGEIGGNDFSFGTQHGKSMSDLTTMVPEIVQAIIRGVRRVIGLRATRIVIPGNFPIGCFPAFLTHYRTDNSTAYDEYHCMKDLNNLAILFNHHLQEAIDELKKECPNITLIYGDYYNAYLWLLQNAPSLGFDKKSLQKACCGTGGDYNFDKTKTCGDPRVPVCFDPSTYISWDGSHLTQKAYSWLTRWLLDDILLKLNCQV